MVIWQLPHDQDYAFPVINQRLIKELHLRFLAKLQLIPCKYELSQGWFTYITSRNCGLYLEEIKTDTAWLLYAIVGHIKRSQPSLICLIWTDLTYFGINEKHFIISLLTKHCFINFVLNYHNQSPSNKFGNFVSQDGDSRPTLLISSKYDQSSFQTNQHCTFSCINTIMQFESLQSEQGL